MNKRIHTAVQRAFQVVCRHHPEVVMMLFTDDIRWHFMDAEGQLPVFADDVEISVLEEMAGVVGDLCDLPILFRVKDFDVFENHGRALDLSA